MSNIQNDLKTLLNQDMSRKEFLRISGAALLGIVGVTGLIQNLQKLSGNSTTKHTTITREETIRGYGNSAYGG